METTGAEQTAESKSFLQELLQQVVGTDHPLLAHNSNKKKYDRLTLYKNKKRSSPLKMNHPYKNSNFK
jgi:hypothetical protein